MITVIFLSNWFGSQLHTCKTHLYIPCRGSRCVSKAGKGTNQKGEEKIEVARKVHSRTSLSFIAGLNNFESHLQSHSCRHDESFLRVWVVLLTAVLWGGMVYPKHREAREPHEVFNYRRSCSGRSLTSKKWASPRQQRQHDALLKCWNAEDASIIHHAYTKGAQYRALILWQSSKLLCMMKWSQSLSSVHVQKPWAAWQLENLASLDVAFRFTIFLPKTPCRRIGFGKVSLDRGGRASRMAFNLSDAGTLMPGEISSSHIWHLAKLNYRPS